MMLKRFLSSGVVLGLFMSTAFANMITNGEQFGFIGGNLGLNSVINKSTETLNWTGGPGSSNTRYAEQGVAGALVIGYVKRFQRVAIGLNGGITYLNNEARSGIYGSFAGSPYSEGDSVKLNHFYEFMFQAGYLLRETSQLYVSAGPAYGKFHFLQSYQFTTHSQPTSSDNAKSLWGINVGIGLKERLSEHLALGVAIQHINFQSQTLQEVHGNNMDHIRYNPSVQIGKIGIEYEFAL